MKRTLWNSLSLSYYQADTLSTTQMRDQINQKLHSLYEQKKSEMYTEYLGLNQECFMNILAKGQLLREQLRQQSK